MRAKGFSRLPKSRVASESAGVRLLTDRLRTSPTLARVLPFVLFAALVYGQGLFGESSRYWVYALRMGLGAWLIWLMRPYVAEMRWAFSWEAVVVGVAVFAVWVGLDDDYPKLGKGGVTWNPFAQFGEGSALAWFYVVVRLVGSSVVVPPIEEVFYRSFLYRFIAKADFQSVPLGGFAWVPMLATAGLFGLAHREWLAGIFCALAYQALVVRKQRLGDAITAHALTNFLLGLYVVGKGDWRFW